eukprot:CAMPEP_0181515308 /NCGR_PEP_ID=MMETSP1110-20121109/63499_1 /TAXON_ID=174948 /ORGANISM="Symbiodinium sp., Strain CCMP421" /LENGTH=36 /DNA_ID= /DNA_START= /DNA_END= /DNA_ORIENTATION=
MAGGTDSASAAQETSGGIGMLASWPSSSFGSSSGWA